MVFKPRVIHEYTRKMGPVDLSDRYLATYSFLPKGFKWYRKLMIHLFSMILTNSFVLNRKYGNRKMSHIAYREYIAEFLIEQGEATATCSPRRQQKGTVYTDSRLQDRHFPSRFDVNITAKWKIPCRACQVCNFSAQQMAKYGHTGPGMKKKFTSYCCKECGTIPLCINPCFEIFHSEKNYRESALK